MLDNIRQIYEQTTMPAEIISSHIIIVLLTTIVVLYNENKRGDIKFNSPKAYLTIPIGIILITVVIYFQVLALYLMPILGFLSVFKIISQKFDFELQRILEVASLPASKLMLVMAFGDNLADILNAHKQFNLKRYSATFLLLLIPVYYGLLFLTWILAKKITMNTEFDLHTNWLFQVPKILNNSFYNGLVLIFVIILIARAFYWRWENGRPWRSDIPDINF